MAYEITQNFITQNRSGRILKPIGIVLHETATPGATDENEQSFYNSGNRQASAHAFVDYDSITQCIPWLEQAWHAGPTANRNYIGIELCHYDDCLKFPQVWNRAVWLFAWVHVNILKLTTVTKDNLMSHAEVSAKWHETDHTDPVSYFKQFGKTVDDFRVAVQAQINIQIGGSDMKKIVVYLGDADVFAALIVSQKNQCPLMSKADYVASGLQADQVIEIGGKPNSTRYTTFKDAADLV